MPRKPAKKRCLPARSGKRVESMTDGLQGLVTDIQRYSLHDGPGIRTSVFLKGCNMRCAWCHNPETLSREVEELVDPDRCIHCGQCAQGCYAGARTTVGRWMRPEEALAQVLLDRPYYGSDGGMTVTGGEPTLQPAFTQALLTLAQAERIHCAMESNLLAPWPQLANLLSHLNLLMCDVKAFDSDLHRRWTGVGNEQILNNLRNAASGRLPVIVRVPVVAGVNDSEENIRHTAAFVAALPGVQWLELLPYHALGLSKHLASGCAQQRFTPPTRQALERLAKAAGEYHIQVRIAGVFAR